MLLPSKQGAIEAKILWPFIQCTVVQRIIREFRRKTVRKEKLVLESDLQQRTYITLAERGFFDG